VGLPPKGYANLSIREDVRRMLDELRAETGIHDLSDLLVVLVRTYRDYTNAISKIQELLTSSASKTLTSSTSKADVAGEVANSAGNPSVSTSGGYEWCRPRSSIKNLEGYVKYLERSLGLEDWWEEDDRVCFRTRVRPAKT
jgi:hypothetical protein